MKKVLLLITLFLAAALSGRAADKFVVDGITYMLSSNKLWVASPENGDYEGDIVIPSEIKYGGKQYTVQGIFSYAFCYDRSLTSVSLPNTITEIGINAFLDCRSLKTLTIPESVTVLDSDPFGACTFDSLIIKCTLSSYAKVFTRMNTASVVYANKSEISKIKRYYSGEVHEIGFIRNPIIDFVRYQLDDTKNTATVVSQPKGPLQLYFGDMAIPETVESQGVTYKVTKVDKRAFAECTSLRSVSLPSTVTEIGSYAFSNSQALQSVTLPTNLRKLEEGLFSGCTVLTDITIPSSVTEIGASAFADCGKLTVVRIPASVYTIGVGAFSGCLNLGKIEVDESSYYFSSVDGAVYSKQQDVLWVAPAGRTHSFAVAAKTVKIAPGAFKGCRYIGEVTMPNSVTEIGDEAFRDCSALSNVQLSLRLKSLGMLAFYGCKSLKRIVLPRRLATVGDGVFSGCQLELVVVLCPVGGTVAPLQEGIQRWEFQQGSMAYNATVYTMNPSEFQGMMGWTVYSLQPSPTATDATPYLRGVELAVHPGADEARPQYIEIGDQRLPATEAGDYYVGGLDISTDYVVAGTFGLQNYSYTYRDLLGEFTTLTPTVAFETLSATQRTVRVRVTSSSDKTCRADEQGVIYGWPETKAVQQGDELTIGNLAPNDTHAMGPYARYGDMTITGSWRSVATQGMSPAITVVRLTPTTALCRGSYKEIDERVASCRFTGYKENETELLLTGLTPNLQLKLTFEVTTSGGWRQSTTKTLTTPQLTLESLTPKVTNRGEVVVCAKTNIADEEPNVGFEWRKVDAPDVVPSKSGKGAVYDGTMEGIIKNLDASAYYKVRPFYESSAGMRYYGEWIGFDPSDFSYFEPTVHTYANAVVTRGSATLTGYALQGSDDIVEQGFEYWVKGLAGVRGAAAGVKTVQASGQRMQAELTGLADGTVYGYRAYVTTVRGTLYGEEMEFTTPVASGLSEAVVAEAAEEAVVSVLTLNGQVVKTYRRQPGEPLGLDTSSLPRGVYIVSVATHSGRQTKKIVVK